MIFDTISIKARWEWWCRWNCDLRVINAWKKGIFCRTESIAMMPKSRDHMPTTSPWGVTAKWPTRAPKMKQETHKDTAVSVWEYRNIVSASKQTPCFIPWGLRNSTHWSAHYTMGVMRRSKKVSLFQLYKLNPLSPHCGSICLGARALLYLGLSANCYSSRQHSRPA